MFTLPHFCRICLKYDKNLIDLAHIENEPSETLMSKLQFCASEVEWNTYKPLLCHPCIKRLNIAYYFKKECIQSANVLKSYIELLKESQLKNQTQNTTEGGSQNQSGTYMLLPNQKYLKILVGPGGQNQNTFQNVFLNVIPTTTASTMPHPQPPALVPTDSPKNKDSNQNIFLNINNIFKKYVPIAPNENAKLTSQHDKNNLSVNQLLTNTKTEELSVEIDPTDFGLGDDSDSSPEEMGHDWEDVIATSKINSDVSISRIPSRKTKGGSQKREDAKSQSSNNTSFNSYVPILPKHGVSENSENDEKIEYFNTGEHFLSPSLTITNVKPSREYFCETCQKMFQRLTDLKHHINTFHMGKLPYKCSYCYVEFAVRSDYELCMKFHKEQEASNTSLTLEDFANGANPGVNPGVSNEENVSQPDDTAQTENSDDFTCNVCHRIFASSTGLLRHKVRKHNQKNKKKYFIKGMKNAKCDICNREFSTQSYMQLHRKLHMRDVSGYKYKVYGKSKYATEEKDKKEKENDNSKEIDPENLELLPIETVDCTPDISFTKEDMESEGEFEKEAENAKAEMSNSEDEDVEMKPIITNVFTVNEDDILNDEGKPKDNSINDADEKSLDEINKKSVKSEMLNGDEMKIDEVEITCKLPSDESIAIKEEANDSGKDEV